MRAGAQKDDFVLDRGGAIQQFMPTPKGIALGPGDESGPLLDQVGKKLEIIEAPIQNEQGFGFG